MIIASTNIWPTGPYSAVRPGEQLEKGQDQAESSGPEPVDELVSGGVAQGTPVRRGPSTQGMSDIAQRSAGAALAAFPQVVHVLANPELHLAKQLSDETGLPVVSLEDTSVDDLEELLNQPQFAGGFILEGFPEDRASAEILDGLLSATDPGGRRVLGFESQSASQQEIVDHYIDQGLLWLVPPSEQQGSPEQVKTTLLECLAGLPVLE